MKRFFNRLWANPITQWVIIGSFAYSAWHCWQAGGEGWGWPLFWGLVGIHAANASSAERRLRELEMDDEPGQDVPPLHARMLGHPLIAWPVVVLCGLVLMPLISKGVDTGAWDDGAFLITFSIFTLPAILALRWTFQRHRWKKRFASPVSAPAPVPTAPQAAPVARVVVPDIPAPPSIAEAMQRLHPSLLALVREGARVEAAQA